MITLLSIAALGLFSYHAVEIHNAFKGAFGEAKIIIGFIGNIGRIMYFIGLVWSFCLYPWWYPLVALIGTIIISGITAFVFQRTLIGIVTTPVLVIATAVLSVVLLA